VPLHQAADALQGEKRRVSLVDVAHGGLDAEHRQGPDSPDPQEDLLPEAHVAVAAVQIFGDAAVLCGVGLQIRIQQVQGHPADLGPPDLRPELPPGKLHLHGYRVPVGPPLQRQWQGGVVRLGVGQGEPGGPFQVVRQLGPDPVQVGQKAFIGDQFAEPLLRDEAQHLDRVGVAPLPEQLVRVQATEKINGLGVPGPPEIHGDAHEVLEAVGRDEAPEVERRLRPQVLPDPRDHLADPGGLVVVARHDQRHEFQPDLLLLDDLQRLQDGGQR
jgi:hypothetical protein